MTPYFVYSFHSLAAAERMIAVLGRLPYGFGRRSLFIQKYENEQREVGYSIWISSEKVPPYRISNEDFRHAVVQELATRLSSFTAGYLTGTRHATKKAREVIPVLKKRKTEAPVTTEG